MVPLGSLTQVLVFKLQQVTPAQSVVMVNVYVKYADHVHRRYYCSYSPSSVWQVARLLWGTALAVAARRTAKKAKFWSLIMSGGRRKGLLQRQ